MKSARRDRKSFIGISAAAAALALASTAAAAPVSDRFDGAYSGAAEVETALSGPGCAPLPLSRIEIREGSLKGLSAEGRYVARGVVTSSGFFTGEYRFADGKWTRFEGRIGDDGVLTGGVMSGNCAWLAKLSRTA
ncbi:hypothetical protein [Amphiplicatus metriothermophilus]|uniref:MORN repeat-containing protein n=1 Tax=Amphiplicatus metriothermophilus TaxID=1519374 RepID=A0A239PVC0_9PROT|nr:hypothetical protein [Amphiplicatus metriothermophilus]MBB5519678.1 hypothetical protein [Amphiplicatus metriothermophilus]SNT74241.1 hypothetical protein SAMN06297382_2152 [Amphiplicatus metriothermophilus]